MWTCREHCADASPARGGANRGSVAELRSSFEAARQNVSGESGEPDLTGPAGEGAAGLGDRARRGLPGTKRTGLERARCC